MLITFLLKTSGFFFGNYNSIGENNYSKNPVAIFSNDISQSCFSTMSQQHFTFTSTLIPSTASTVLPDPYSTDVSADYSVVTPVISLEAAPVKTEESEVCEII